jgi:hypothetical protein
LNQVVLASVTGAVMAGSVSAAVTLTFLASFGGGDDWLAPGEGPAAALGTANLGRGFAYSPVSGSLTLVSGNGTLGNPIQILNGTTGALFSNLQQAGVPSGGTFVTNLAGVGDDGAIYVSNLSTSATSHFKVCRWGNEADLAPTSPKMPCQACHAPAIPSTPSARASTPIWSLRARAVMAKPICPPLTG